MALTVKQSLATLTTELSSLDEFLECRDLLDLLRVNLASRDALLAPSTSDVRERVEADKLRGRQKIRIRSAPVRVMRAADPR